MKILVTFFISITCIVNTYSQRICEYGEYDFILNKIKGIDKSSFSIVKFTENEKPFFIYKYNSLSLLTNIEFYRARIKRSPCDDAKTISYTHLDKKGHKIIRINSDDVIRDAVIIYDTNGNIKQIKDDNFLTIDYEYNSKNQIKRITKSRKVYTYFWNKNSQIEKINILFLNDKTQQEITFSYNNKKLKKVSHIKTRQGFELINSLFTYKYKNNRICRITKLDKEKVKTASKNTLYYNFDYSDKDKLIITMKNSDKEYLNHYECYY